MVEKLENKHLWKELLAEFVGTFVLLFLGLFSCLGGSVERIAFAFGLAVASMAQFASNICKFYEIIYHLLNHIILRSFDLGILEDSADRIELNYTLEYPMLLINYLLYCIIKVLSK
uniref:Uncharacterized protein n=1 Tax=Glossina morsitans morsitans TaxID=37546 RepID=A0A1B0FGH5_GLOMM